MPDETFGVPLFWMKIFELHLLRVIEFYTIQHTLSLICILLFFFDINYEIILRLILFIINNFVI